MIQAIVTDIEGTTSSLSFVKEVLFPYARQQLPAYVLRHAEEDPVKSLLADVCQEVGQTLSTAQLIEQLLTLIEEDKKATPLKSLQGLLWEAGYQQGDFTGHVYTDAAEQLPLWKNQGLALYVYSSGSVHAQKLLFTHSDYGDLTPLFSGYFDTHIGAKRERQSYEKIAEAIALPAQDILFLSDIKEELDAAQDAGFKTIWLVRAGIVDVDADHRQVSSFAEISV
jgi:enolase-phosphatase E1